MNQQPLDIAIVGAGAAGLMAAIFAGRSGRGLLRIAAIDGAKKVGAKILVAGGGRCNVTHHAVTPDDFHGTSRNTIARILRTFDVPATIAFFRDIGVELKREETGKLFPTTDDAHTVLEALLRSLDAAGATLITDSRVNAVRHDGDGFHLETSTGAIVTRSLILATGGKALPKSGSDGGGYELAKALGHSVTATTPALVPLILPVHHWLTELSGLAMDVTLTLATGSGKVIERVKGAMLLTHFGVSGPAVLDISRSWLAARAKDPYASLTANTLLHADFAAADAWLVERANARPRATPAAVVAGRLPARFADALTHQAIGDAASLPISRLTKDDRRKLAHALTALPLPVIGDRGYTFAEATAGGVPLDEINPVTMSSRRRPGLYLCGEILDVDGRIGGFNFQWAWATGRLAGGAAARELTDGATSSPTTPPA